MRGRNYGNPNQSMLTNKNSYYIYYIPTNAPRLKHKSGLRNKPVALTVEAPAHFPEETSDFFQETHSNSISLPQYFTASP